MSQSMTARSECYSEHRMPADAPARRWLDRLFPRRRATEKMITALREEMAREQKNVVRELRDIRRTAEQGRQELQTALAAHEAALAALPELQARIDRCMSVYVQDAKSAAKVSEFRSRVDRTEILAHVTAAVGRATIKDFVDAIDYGVKLIGIDHIGISSDFDGGGGIDGWNSAAETFNVTLELVRRGYTEEQIGKSWSGNLLRVWGEVERVAKDIQTGRR